MLESENEIEELEDFFMEIPTVRCGENGCAACDLAFHHSCDPVLALHSAFAPPTVQDAQPLQGDGIVHVEDEWEADTQLDIRPLFLEDDDPYSVLGGEG
jgi:hypothetical protein